MNQATYYTLIRHCLLVDAVWTHPPNVCLTETILRRLEDIIFSVSPRLAGRSASCLLFCS